jgi:hypothetical protein
MSPLQPLLENRDSKPFPHRQHLEAFDRPRDFIEEVKRVRAREGVRFNNDLFNELYSSSCDIACSFRGQSLACQPTGLDPKHGGQNNRSFFLSLETPRMAKKVIRSSFRSPVLLLGIIWWFCEAILTIFPLFRFDHLRGRS